MKKLAGLLLAMGLVLGGCGSDPCEDAADKIKECGGTDSDGAGDGECSGNAECLADCINDHSCEQINSLDDGPFSQCVAKCI